MSKLKTILFDLDGTLANSMSKRFTPYRNGQQPTTPNDIPLFAGAKDTIKHLLSQGHEVFIVSDSHPRYVGPISEQVFGLKALDLAYKPTIEKTKHFIDDHSRINLSNARSRFFLVGDTSLDIITARKLGILSIHLVHLNNVESSEWHSTQKAGPTFTCYSFDELQDIIKDPLPHFLTLEGLEYSQKSRGAIDLHFADYTASAGRRFYAKALARQQTGSCDRFAQAKSYQKFSSESREDRWLKKIADQVGRYIQYFQQENGLRFDILSFVPDKHNTKPPKKMERFTHLIDINIPIKQTLDWKPEVKGSIRHYPHRRGRYKFVRQFMHCTDQPGIAGKNIIIVDDQVTTGATMDAIVDMLRNRGVNHILFLALYRMIDEVGAGIICPRCGKGMSLRHRRSNQQPFYSCVPQRYGGVGCGFIQNIDNA